MDDTTPIFETLNRLGITRSQSKLYVEILKTGPSTIAQTARVLNTSRQAIYLLLPALLDRGLIKEIRHSKRVLYQALPPSQLLDLLEDIKTRLDEIIPTLTNLQNVPSEVPLITIYDSPLAMREWYRHFLDRSKEGDEFLLYDSGNIDTWYKLDPEFYTKYMEQQVKKHIRLLCLLPVEKRTDEFIKKVGWSITEYRHTSQTLSKKVEQWVWQDEVCYQTIQGNSTNLIVLKSRALADFAHKQFMEIWDSSQSTKQS